MADKTLASLLVDIRAGTSQLQQDMDKAVGILQRSGGLMSNIVKGIGQGMGQALGRDVFQIVGKLAGGLNALADAGNKAGAIADSFHRIGGSSEAVERARKAVMGTVSAFDLMKVANQGVIRGLPDMNKNLALLAEYSNRFADASGRDTVEVMNALTAAIGSGSNKALQEFGITVDQSASKSEKMTQALDQVRSNMEKLVPPAESVSAAHQDFQISLTDALKTVGMGVNDNQELAKVYRDLSKAIGEIDWRSIGEGIASTTAAIARALPSLQTFAGWIEDIGRGVRVLTGDLTKTDRLGANLNQAAGEVRALEKEIASLEADGGKVGANGSGMLGGWMDSFASANAARLEQAKKQLEEKRKILLEVGKQLKTAEEAVNAPVLGPADPRTMGMIFNNKKNIWQTGQEMFGGGNGGTEFDRAAREIERLKERWAETTARIREDSLKDAIDDSIKGLDVQGFETLKNQLSEQVYQAFINGNQEFLKAGVSMDELKAQAEAVAAAQVQEYQEKMDDALWKERQERLKMISDLAEEEAEQRRRLAEYYGLDGTSRRNSLAYGIQSLSSSLGGNYSALGQYADRLESAARYMNDSATFLGNSMTTAQAHSMGVQGPGMQNGNFGSGSSWMSGLGTYMQAAGAFAQTWNSQDYGSQLNGKNHQIMDSIHSAGMVVANAWTFGLASVVEGIVGRENMEKFSVGRLIVKAFFNENAETFARHQFANWMEDRFKEMGGFDVRQQDGSFKKITNFVEGDKTRFNDPDWAEGLTKQSGEVQRTFLGLGNGLKELLGITEDVGDQIALVLGENLAYNIDNARHLVQRLGLSFDEIEEKLVDVGLKGTKTWLEVETQIQGVAEAFKPGLSAIGDFNQAFQNTLNSGARGFEAVQGIRDVFVEAQEAGLSTFDQLRQGLLKTFDPETVDAFFASLNQRGVTTIQAGVDLTDRQAGGVVADMQAMGVKFQDTGDHIADSVADLNSATSSNTQATIENTSALKGLGNINIQYPASPDDGEEPMAAGGVAFGPKRVLMGEAGPEAVLPLTRKNGRLGVSLHGIQGGGGGYVVNIDARGAAPGVEKRLQAAFKDQQRRMARDIFRSLEQQRGRGA